MDYPRKELERRANAVLAGDPTALVFFKATCPACGERPEFNEPNALFEQMECSNCGVTFPFERGGFSVMFGVGRERWEEIRKGLPGGGAAQ